MMKRSNKLVYASTSSMGPYQRLTNLTEFTVDSNVKEFTRKYIDEDQEKVITSHHQPSISYKFDYEKDNEGHEIFKKVADSELVGKSANVYIAIANKDDIEKGINEARVGEFVIIPSKEGDDEDMYTYSGTLKATGKRKLCMVETDEDLSSLTVSDW